MNIKIAALAAVAFGVGLSAALPSFAATMQCAPQAIFTGAPYPGAGPYTADAAGIVQNVNSNDIKALEQAGCGQLGVTNGLCGHLLGVNMNVGGAGAVGDQKFNWFLATTQTYHLTKIVAQNASRSFAAGSAAGGVYTAAAKGGSAVVAAGQVYTALAGSNATATLNLTLVAGVGTLGVYTNAPLYFSLTTADGSAGTLDLFAFCDVGN